MGGRTLAYVAMGLLAGVGPARAAVDVGAAMPALLKVLTYDENFDSRGAGPFTVLIVGDAAQARERDALLATLKAGAVRTVKARPVSYAAAPYRDAASLQAAIDRTRASAVLLLPGTPLPTVRAVWDVAQDNQLYALALEAAMVEQLLPLGVTMEGERPQIIINERSARAVGARFATSVLRLARVIQ